MKNVTLKRKYIEAAFEIVKNEGRSGVTIRRLAKTLNCNIASLYRCFYDLDDLFLYTGMKYIEEYLRDLREVLDQPYDCLEMYFQVWSCFIDHAFQDPKMYNTIFFGKNSRKLEYVTSEYFTDLFPDELAQFDEDARDILMKGSLENGDSTISKLLIKCVDEEVVSEEVRRYLDRLFLQVFKGYLKDFIDGRRSRGANEEAKKELIYYIRTIMNHCKTGNNREEQSYG